jgi:hypothetical protein
MARAPQPGELELLRDPVELGALRLLESRAWRLEDAAGVGQGRVEKERVEVGPEIVVIADVRAAPRHGIAVPEVPGALDPARDRRRQPRAGVEGVLVAHRQPNDGDQIRRAPEALGVGLAERDVAAADAAREDALVVDQDDRVEIRRGVAEAADRAAGKMDLEAAAGDSLERPKEERARRGSHGTGPRHGLARLRIRLAERQRLGGRDQALEDLD